MDAADPRAQGVAFGSFIMMTQSGFSAASLTILLNIDTGFSGAWHSSLQPVDTLFLYTAGKQRDILTLDSVEISRGKIPSSSK